MDKTRKLYFVNAIINTAVSGICLIGCIALTVISWMDYSTGMGIAVVFLFLAIFGGIIGTGFFIGVTANSARMIARCIKGAKFGDMWVLPVANVVTYFLMAFVFITSVFESVLYLFITLIAAAVGVLNCICADKNKKSKQNG